MGYNLKFCDFISLLMIWDSKTHMFSCYNVFTFYISFFCIELVWFALCFLGLDFYIVASESHLLNHQKSFLVVYITSRFGFQT